MPLIVHSRAADGEMVGILQEESSNGAFPGVLHCFSSGAQLAHAALELGFYISFSGILTFKNAQAVRDINRASVLGDKRILSVTNTTLYV